MQHCASCSAVADRVPFACLLLTRSRWLTRSPFLPWSVAKIRTGAVVENRAINRHGMQNLGEAEYIVAFYKYLRLKGVPAANITMLSTCVPLPIVNRL